VVVGAIAEQLVRLAPCPVLAVAADWNAGLYRPTPGGPVLLAMERNDAAAAAAATAFSLAETFERPLLVLHVRTAAETGGGTNPCATMEDFGSRPRGKAQVRCLVKDGDPADAWLEAIAGVPPVHAGGGVKRASATPGPHGTAFALLSASRVPVLCVPPKEAHAGSSGKLRFPWESGNGRGSLPRLRPNFIQGGMARRMAGGEENRTMLSDQKNSANSAGMALSVEPC